MIQTDKIQSHLLEQIEQYCKEHGISLTAFGQKSVNDGCLVSDLRKGRDPRWSTIVRVLSYMDKAQHPNQSGDA